MVAPVRDLARLWLASWCFVASGVVAVARQQELMLQACAGLGGVAERCSVTLDASACAPDSKCSRLVVLFSGGEMGCALKGRAYAEVQADYSAHGWASACVNVFETSTGSGALPYYKEADRYDMAVAAVTQGEWAAQLWTGEYLLLQGISHGASAPLIAMARGRLQAQRAWQGSVGTAGCFFDGSVNQAATAALLATGTPAGGPCTFPVPYSRLLARYCDDAGCNLSTNAEALMDTIEDAPAGNFSLKKWRITECGSALAACSADIIPAAPLERLCSGLANSTSHSCEFIKAPQLSHLTCHGQLAHECREWFDARLFPPPAAAPPSSPARANANGVLFLSMALLLACGAPG
jgi:hypothetical protein